MYQVVEVAVVVVVVVKDLLSVEVEKVGMW